MTSASAATPHQSPKFCDRLGAVTPKTTAATPDRRAPTSPMRTTVTPTPTSHDHETAHNPRARIPRPRHDQRTRDDQRSRNITARDVPER